MKQNNLFLQHSGILGKQVFTKAAKNIFVGKWSLVICVNNLKFFLNFLCECLVGDLEYLFGVGE